MFTLYSYYRSTAAYRVRIALNYKEIPYQIVPVNLRENAQLSGDYRLHNPQSRVPTLVCDGWHLGQSSAILEYLEETKPTPALLPRDAKGRAWVRYFSQIIISDMHPLNNSGVLKYLEHELKQSEDNILCWYHHWLGLGFAALEALIVAEDVTNNFCYGDTPTLADVCLIPQLYNAKRFQFALDAYPNLCRIESHCLDLPAFLAASPARQPDYEAQKKWP